jgi:TrmH family RNA methyltransferase
VLTSANNRKVTAATRLKKRAFRQDDRLFLVEGAQGVAEALDAGGLTFLFTTDDLHELAIRARQLGVDVQHVSEDVMGKITSTVTPQGLVGVAPFCDVPIGELPAGGCLAVLHEVRDPGNAGTVLRSADAAGAAGVVFTESSVDLYNPKTVRASAGSVFHLPVVRGVPTVDAVEHARGRGYRLLAMDARGREDLYATDLSGSIAFLFGNEASGLPENVLAIADVTVRVPHTGKAESLNLAAAATVCLFEWARRRTSGGRPALESIVGAAAHDIRSPLTAMKGFGFALEKRWDQMTDEQRAMMLQGIVHDADRMDTILRQLVDAARVVGGNLEPFPESVDVAQLVGDLATQQSRDPEHPAIDWTGDDPCVAFLDPTRLKTTLLAFFESLVWWAHEGSIRVDARLDGGRLHLAASRAGTDLDSHEADALFTPREPGTGAGSKIGMFVARGVAQVMDGRTWGDVDDRRLFFHVELPATPADSRA